MSRAGKTRTRQSVDARVEARDTVLSGCTGLSPAIRKEDTMIRAALYARYSSDQQSAASIADQQRVCRERATREGWQIVGSFEDAAISGASMILRPGIQKLLADAQAGKFDIVRSEEHTSELQSLMRISYAVFCLKKKTKEKKS